MDELVDGAYYVVHYTDEPDKREVALWECDKWWTCGDEEGLPLSWYVPIRRIRL